MTNREQRLRGIRDSHRNWHHAFERKDYASMDSIEGKRYHQDIPFLLAEIERLDEMISSVETLNDDLRQILVSEGYNIEKLEHYRGNTVSR